MKVEIPDEERKLIEKWLVADDEPIEKVLSALESAQPTLRRESLARIVATATDLPSDSVDEALGIFFNLVRTISSAEPEDDAVASVFRAVVGEVADAEKLKRFSARVQRICGSRAVQITSKAVSVLYENPNTFCRARIVSELRPVFTNELKAEAALAIHQLKIVFHTGPALARDEFFVTLDRDDLEALKKEIERALQKHSELVRVADKVQVLQ